MQSKQMPAAKARPRARGAIRGTIERGDRVQAVSIAYHGGLRYPWLEKIGDAKTPAGLDLLLSPRRP